MANELTKLLTDRLEECTVALLAEHAKVQRLEAEMTERDAQWLDLIETLENYEVDGYGLPLDMANNFEIEAATNWITCALKNLGLARHVIEHRAAIDTKPND
jgi:hypothetical protein